jgi:hypothetical protein
MRNEVRAYFFGGAPTFFAAAVDAGDFFPPITFVMSNRCLTKHMGVYEIVTRNRQPLRNGRRYHALLWVGGKQFSLGIFDDSNDAACAVDNAIYWAIHRVLGGDKPLNFPHDYANEDRPQPNEKTQEVVRWAESVKMFRGSRHARRIKAPAPGTLASIIRNARSIARDSSALAREIEVFCANLAPDTQAPEPLVSGNPEPVTGNPAPDGSQDLKSWTCGCGATNGVNLATCAVCNRTRSVFDQGNPSFTNGARSVENARDLVTGAQVQVTSCEEPQTEAPQP